MTPQEKFDVAVLLRLLDDAIKGSVFVTDYERRKIESVREQVQS